MHTYSMIMLDPVMAQAGRRHVVPDFITLLSTAQSLKQEFLFLALCIYCFQTVVDYS